MKIQTVQVPEYDIRINDNERKTLVKALEVYFKYCAEDLKSEFFKEKVGELLDELSLSNKP